MSLLMEGGSLRRLAFSASKRLSMPSFSKRSTLRYRVRSAEPVSRDLRLRLRLVPVDGEWLTSEIEPVD